MNRWLAIALLLVAFSISASSGSIVSAQDNPGIVVVNNGEEYTFYHGLKKIVTISTYKEPTKYRYLIWTSRAGGPNCFSALPPEKAVQTFNFGIVINCQDGIRIARVNHFTWIKNAQVFSVEGEWLEIGYTRDNKIYSYNPRKNIRILIARRVNATTILRFSPS
jgi:hypothetical protein